MDLTNSIKPKPKIVKKKTKTLIDSSEEIINIVFGYNPLKIIGNIGEIIYTITCNGRHQRITFLEIVRITKNQNLKVKQIKSILKDVTSSDNEKSHISYFECTPDTEKVSDDLIAMQWRKTNRFELPIKTLQNMHTNTTLETQKYDPENPPIIKIIHD